MVDLSPEADLVVAPKKLRGGQELALSWARLAFFAAPIVVGFVRRYVSGDWWFNDLDAVLCGAWRVAHGASPYVGAMACPGGQPAAYVYLPQLAHLLSVLAQGPDITGLRLIFGPMVLTAAAVLSWLIFVQPMAGSSGKFRAPLLGLTSGGAIASANLAYPLHLMILGATSLRRGGPWPLILAIVIASVVKPVLLTYLLIFAYRRDRLALRAQRIAAGLTLAALGAIIVVATAGGDLGAWREAIEDVAFSPSQLGFGFFAWMHDFAPTMNGAALLSAYAVFAAAVCLMGLVVAESGRLDDRSRIMLAIGVAQLVNPRLMVYDMLMLAPLAIAFEATTEASRKWFGYALVAVGAAVALMHLSGIQGVFRRDAMLLTMLLAAAAILVVGALPPVQALRFARSARRPHPRRTPRAA